MSARASERERTRTCAYQVLDKKYFIIFPLSVCTVKDTTSSASLLSYLTVLLYCSKDARSAMLDLNVTQ